MGDGGELDRGCGKVRIEIYRAKSSFLVYAAGTPAVLRVCPSTERVGDGFSIPQLWGLRWARMGDLIRERRGGEGCFYTRRSLFGHFVLSIQ